VVACSLAVLLIVLNIRGVKESIAVMVPIFMVFVLTHIIMLVDGIFTHTERFAPLTRDFHAGLSHDISTIGIFGIQMLLLPLTARLFARRRDLHRHRSGLQRPADHA
jgi:cell shape-determining protein MreD